MGERGPPPKRSDQRRRRNKTAGEERADKAETESAPTTEIEVPPPDDDWHPVAKRWYESLATSGQAAFYQPSDWATAQVIAESMSRELNPQPLVVGKGDDAKVEMVKLPPKGASLAAWLRGMTALMVTEGDRRRAAMELQRPVPSTEEGGKNVSSLDAWRSRIDGTG